MIRSLQRRFVRTAMVSLLLLLFILFSGITTILFISMDRNNNDLLEQLSDVSEPVQPSEPASSAPEGDSLVKGIMLDQRYTALQSYFVAHVSTTYKIESVNILASPSLDEAAAEELVQKAISLESESGYIDSYKFKITTLDEGGYSIAFVDYAPQLQVLLSSLGAALTMTVFTSVLMFLILIIVSRRAVQPIADSMEKQRKFVTDAGHEIGTPLAIISANSEALEMHYGESKWNNNIQNQVKRLDGLMKQLLALSRFDEETQKIVRQEIDLGELVGECLESVIEIVAQKNLSFSEKITPSVIVEGDSAGLYQLVMVLIDNAIKYADDSTEITVLVAKEDKSVIFELSNACSNLPDVPPKTLLDRFYRGDTARTQKSGGYGIGLSIAMAVVELHNGSIEIFFDSPTRIRFRVELPAK